MKFPKIENDILSLADQILAGLTTHPGDFPSITLAQKTQLETVLADAKGSRTQMDEAKSQAQIAVVVKNDFLDQLITLMKGALKKAETDCVIDPEKLTEIGWGPRNEPVPIIAPGVPSNLRSIAEGTGEIWLGWDKPPADTGGLVRNYLVERCEKGADGNFGPWMLVDTTYNNEAHVVEQPSNARLIFRVKAANGGGVSAPSNTILVVLP